MGTGREAGQDPFGDGERYGLAAPGTRHVGGTGDQMEPLDRQGDLGQPDVVIAAKALDRHVGADPDPGPSPQSVAIDGAAAGVGYWEQNVVGAIDAVPFEGGVPEPGFEIDVASGVRSERLLMYGARPSRSTGVTRCWSCPRRQRKCRSTSSSVRRVAVVKTGMSSMGREESVGQRRVRQCISD